MKTKDFVSITDGIHMKDSTRRRIAETCRKRAGKNASAGATFRLSKRVIAAACAAAFVLTCSVTAFATDLFGLREMLMTQRTEEGLPQDTISLIGYMNSDEAKACRDWNDFLDTYDTDRALLNQVGNAPTGLEESETYMVYTPEMAQKLHEIADSYHLELLRSLDICETGEDLLKALGRDALTRSGEALTNEVDWGYVYNEGSFRMEGTVTADGSRIAYQCSACRKGVLHEPALNIGDASSYREYAYTASDGVDTLLAIGSDKSLIIADTGSRFVVVNILEGSDTVTEERLKAIADSFLWDTLR